MLTILVKTPTTAERFWWGVCAHMGGKNFDPSLFERDVDNEKSLMRTWKSDEVSFKEFKM
ncbi:MAG: hypothetical protein ACREBS_00615 [Nitrososphaerales archaeon]